MEYFPLGFGESETDREIMESLCGPELAAWRAVYDQWRRMRDTGVSIECRQSCVSGREISFHAYRPTDYRPDDYRPASCRCRRVICGRSHEFVTLCQSHEPPADAGNGPGLMPPRKT